MRRLFVFPLLLFALIPASVGASFRDWPPVTVNGLPGVVMPRDVARDVIWAEGEIEGYWLPGEPRLEAAEDAIAERAGLIEEPDRAPMLAGYRQYGGFIEHGERKIFVNSFCKDFDDWRGQYILVMDGGPCFWNAVYNVDTGEVEHLYVNGSA